VIVVELFAMATTVAPAAQSPAGGLVAEYLAKGGKIAKIPPAHRKLMSPRWSILRTTNAPTARAQRGEKLNQND
jgi:hypothetical protein